ncbi:MAG: hypothetical protein RL071_4681, partial [Pseudomonadota bacterium]
MTRLSPDEEVCGGPPARTPPT